MEVCTNPHIPLNLNAACQQGLRPRGCGLARGGAGAEEAARGKGKNLPQQLLEKQPLSAAFQARARQKLEALWHRERHKCHSQLRTIRPQGSRPPVPAFSPLREPASPPVRHLYGDIERPPGGARGGLPEVPPEVPPQSPARGLSFWCGAIGGAAGEERAGPGRDPPPSAAIGGSALTALSPQTWRSATRWPWASTRATK